MGGDGCDTLLGGAGNDLLRGGAGADAHYGGTMPTRSICAAPARCG